MLLLLLLLPCTWKQMAADSLSLTTRKFVVFRRSTLPTPASRKPVTVSCLQAVRGVLQRIMQHTQSSLLRSETIGGDQVHKLCHFARMRLVMTPQQDAPHHQ
jgi:hypothetical protein